MSGAETILVVDDEALLRMNLRAFLEDLGFAVQEAGNGLEALEACGTAKPDLILMDISMPMMDGIEACERLKGDPATAEIPILFLSALMRSEDKVRAFKAGAVDYLTKPYHLEEVEARVRAHLELHAQRRLLREQNEALRDLEHQRDTFTHMMAHDLRSPLTALMGSLDLLEMALEDEFPGASGTSSTHLDRIRRAATQVLSRITQMLDVSRLESGSMPVDARPMDLVATAAEAIQNLAGMARDREVRLSAPGRLEVEGDAGLILRVIENLLGNALKFTPAGGRIEVCVEGGPSGPRVRVIDGGPGISPEQQTHLFQKFRQVGQQERLHGSGLGLAFCRLAVEAHRGAIGCCSESGAGAEFWFSIPEQAAR